MWIVMNQKGLSLSLYGFLPRLILCSWKSLKGGCFQQINKWNPTRSVGFSESFLAFCPWLWYPEGSKDKVSEFNLESQRVRAEEGAGTLLAALLRTLKAAQLRIRLIDSNLKYRASFYEGRRENKYKESLVDEDFRKNKDSTIF